ncbi:MAG: site-2 protease family protein [Dermatophilaceae bacterium]
MTSLVYLLGVLAVVALIGLSIALHELGHLVPAKRFGVRCTKYMIGFGPTVWSRVRGDTEYGIKAIPLGGYVKMIGMIPPRPGDAPGQLRSTTTGRMSIVEQARADSMDEIEPGDEDRVFYKLPVHKKIIVMLGGPFMNLALAVVLLTVLVSGIGLPTTVPKLGSVAQCVPSAAPTVAKPQPECAVGDAAPPSVAAGLRAGDRIVEVNGTPVTLWSEVTTKIRAAAGQTMTLTVERTGERLTVSAPIVGVERAAYTAEGKVRLNPDGTVLTERVGFLGATATADYVALPVTEVPMVFGRLVSTVASALGTFPEKLVGVAKTLAGQADRDPEGPVSVVGIGRVGGEIATGAVASDGPKGMIYQFIWLVLGLNLMLFFFNLLPVLPLDGGQVVGAVWEGIKRTWARVTGRPDPGYVDVAKGLPIAYAVSILLIGMTLMLAVADLVKPISLG